MCKNLRMRLCVSMWRTFPVSGSMTGSRWILFFSREYMASKRLWRETEDGRTIKGQRSGLEVLVYLESGVMLIREVREYCRYVSGRGNKHKSWTYYHVCWIAYVFLKLNNHLSTFQSCVPPAHRSEPKMKKTNVAFVHIRFLTLHLLKMINFE